MHGGSALALYLALYMRQFLLAFAAVFAVPAVPALAAPKPNGSPPKAATPPLIAPEPRFSLSLRDVPLPELLSQVSAATNLRFRFATPPDARVSASFQNAPLFSALEDTLRVEGLSLLRDGENAWILRLNQLPPSPLKLPRSGKTPKLLPRASIPMTSIAPGQNDGWQLRLAPNKWKRVALEADSREWPGVRVLNATQSEVWLRYRFRLREVPKGLRLLLRTPKPATLRLNGAVLRHNADGVAAFDVAHALRAGVNILDVQWRPARIPAAWRGTVVESSHVVWNNDWNGAQNGGDLRYEWLLGDAAMPPGTSLEAQPGGFRLVLLRR